MYLKNNCEYGMANELCTANSSWAVGCETINFRGFVVSRGPSRLAKEGYFAKSWKKQKPLSVYRHINRVHNSPTFASRCVNSSNRL